MTDDTFTMTQNIAFPAIVFSIACPLSLQGAHAAGLWGLLSILVAIPFTPLPH